MTMLIPTDMPTIVFRGRRFENVGGQPVTHLRGQPASVAPPIRSPRIKSINLAARERDDGTCGYVVTFSRWNRTGNGAMADFRSTMHFRVSNASRERVRRAQTALVITKR